jgi:hypothetical protein
MNEQEIRPDVARISNRGPEYGEPSMQQREAGQAMRVTGSYASTPGEVDTLLNRNVEGIVSGALTYNGKLENRTTLQQALDAIGAQVLRELAHRRNMLIDKINEAKFLRADNDRAAQAVERERRAALDSNSRANRYARVIDDITSLFVPNGHDIPLPGELALYIATICATSSGIAQSESIERTVHRCRKYVEQHKKQEGDDINA